MTIIVLIVALVFGPVVASLLIEAMRPVPPALEKLAWAAKIPIQYVSVNGHRLRYIKAGQGPNLVLLHTLRTQLDIFQKVIPALAQRFTVYAPDYPGHGYSEIPKADYDANLFVDAVAGFLDRLAIRNFTLPGISIGGTFALLLAAQHHPFVKKVVAINPYDYARGSGMRRSSWVAKLIFTFSLIPVLGDTVMRFRNRNVEKFIFEGGVAQPDAIPAPLPEEFFIVGTRPGHYQAFLNLLRIAYKREQAHTQYANIKVPVLLLYGERDWSRPIERETTFREIPGAKLQSVAGGAIFCRWIAHERLSK